MINMITMINLI